MKKQSTSIIALLIFLSAALYVQAQQTIAQPYYGEGKIRFYNKANPTAASPCYTLDISADINTNWGVTAGINSVVIYQSKLFVSIDAGNGTGGVLVYNYASVYPTKTGGPAAVLKPQNTSGLPVAGIAIQPSTGNLFVGTFYTGASDAGIYTYTASSGYANSSAVQFASYNNDPSVTTYIADLAFDAAGDLWFTEFDGNTSSSGNYLICYKGANKNNYYKIINPTSKAYTATPPSGGAGTAVYLLSQPEGIAFDASGNLWLGNNNDDYLCNNAGDGTLVKISASWITGTLFSQAYGSTLNVPSANANVYYISGGKLGGLFFDGNNLYINDQGQNQGSSYTSNGTVWKWNTTTAFNTTNFTASGIHTTYPGNGLMALDNAQFSLSGACNPVVSSAKNILTFTIPSQIGSSTIDTVNATVSVLMPSSANLASLTPTITVSAGASINPLSGVAQNFSAPRTYTVTAANASTRTWTVTVTKQAQTGGGHVAQARAATLGKGISLSIWLESGYWFFSTTNYPDVSRYTEADIKGLHDLCFNTIRLPVFFEPFASQSAPYTFDMNNQNVVRGLAYVDSVIAWTGRYNMDLVIDNHLADDNNSNNLQTNYQITDANYVSRAALIAGVWRQAAQRYAYADPNRVFFELRNEPNSVSDAHLRTVYQTVIDTVRKYDHTHTLIVGCTGYYDAVALANSTPYTDTNLIYTFHIYDGNAHPGFCFQGQGGVPATDSLAGTHTSFALGSAQATDITSEVSGVQAWSAAHGVPVWLGEFGCTTLPEVYGDQTSRCNYIKTMADALNAANTPWAYWDGYGPESRFISYDGGTTLNYTFSMFDATNILSAAHLDPCFATDLGLGAACNPNGINDIAEKVISLYPNPASSRLFIKAQDASVVEIFNVVGEVMQSLKVENETIEVNISGFTSGIYFAKIQYADGTWMTKKFVKE